MNLRSSRDFLFNSLIYKQKLESLALCKARNTCKSSKKRHLSSPQIFRTPSAFSVYSNFIHSCSIIDTLVLRWYFLTILPHFWPHQPTNQLTNQPTNQPTTNQQPINQPPTNDQPMDWPTNQPSDSRLKDKETNEWNGQRTSLRDVGLRYWFPSQLCPSRHAVLYCIILHKLSVIYYSSGWTIF